MRLFTPGQSKRLNEVTGFVLLAGGILFLLSMASFRPQDPSWNTVAGAVRTSNLIGPAGAHLADLSLQAFGLTAAVHVSGVDQGSSGSSKGSQLSLGDVLVAVTTPAHRAEPEARHDQPALSEATVFHRR